MKVRFIGTEKEFEKLKVDDFDRNKFVSFRKPQAGRNPKYDQDQNLLMYIELDSATLIKCLKPLRKVKDTKQLTINS